MSYFFSLSLFFFLFSCTNLKHATDITLTEVKHFKNNFDQQDFWNGKVKTLKSVGLECKLIGEVTGKDNIFDQGKEYSVLYMKVNAHKMGADAILVKKINQVGNYGHEAVGEAYSCESKYSK